jgi:hypothetical protein
MISLRYRKITKGILMADTQDPREQRSGMPKMVNLKEDGYYSNCSMVETTPFDISILFGKIRPRTDERGQASLVEVYEKQIYLSHMQARALFEALGKSLSAMARAQEGGAPAETTQPGAPRPVGVPRSGGSGGSGKTQ